MFDLFADMLDDCDNLDDSFELGVDVDSDVILSVSIPQELYIKMQNVSRSFRSNLNDDLIHLMECYVDSFQKLQKDPAANILFYADRK